MRYLNAISVCKGLMGLIGMTQNLKSTVKKYDMTVTDRYTMAVTRKANQEFIKDMKDWATIVLPAGSIESFRSRNFFLQM